MSTQEISIISIWLGCIGIAVGTKDGIVGLILGICALTTTKIILGK